MSIDLKITKVFTSPPTPQKSERALPVKKNYLLQLNKRDNEMHIVYYRLHENLGSNSFIMSKQSIPLVNVWEITRLK